MESRLEVSLCHSSRRAQGDEKPLSTSTEAKKISYAGAKGDRQVYDHPPLVDTLGDNPKLEKRKERSGLAIKGPRIHPALTSF